MKLIKKLLRITDPPVDENDLAECTGCQRLGQCCYLAVPLFGDVHVYSDIPCPYLADDGRCSRYATRLEVPWCRAAKDPTANLQFPSYCPHYDKLKPVVLLEQIARGDTLTLLRQHVNAVARKITQQRVRSYDVR